MVVVGNAVWIVIYFLLFCHIIIVITIIGAALHVLSFFLFSSFFLFFPSFSFQAFFFFFYLFFRYSHVCCRFVVAGWLDDPLALRKACHHPPSSNYYIALIDVPERDDGGRPSQFVACSKYRTSCRCTRRPRHRRCTANPDVPAAAVSPFSRCR